MVAESGHAKRPEPLKVMTIPAWIFVGLTAVWAGTYIVPISFEFGPPDLRTMVCVGFGGLRVAKMVAFEGLTDRQRDWVDVERMPWRQRLRQPNMWRDPNSRWGNPAPASSTYGAAEFSETSFISWLVLAWLLFIGRCVLYRQGVKLRSLWGEIVRPTARSSSPIRRYISRGLVLALTTLTLVPCALCAIPSSWGTDAGRLWAGAIGIRSRNLTNEFYLYRDDLTWACISLGSGWRARAQLELGLPRTGAAQEHASHFRVGWWFSMSRFPYQTMDGRLSAASYPGCTYTISGRVWTFTSIAALLMTYPTIALFRGPVRRVRRRAVGQCVACGYDLAGLPEPRCPECGMLHPHMPIDMQAGKHPVETHTQ